MRVVGRWQHRSVLLTVRGRFAVDHTASSRCRLDIKGIGGGFASVAGFWSGGCRHLLQAEMLVDEGLVLPGSSLINSSIRSCIALGRAPNHHVLAGGTDDMREGPLGRSARIAVITVMLLLLLVWAVDEDLRVLGRRTRTRLALHVPLLATMLLLCNLHVPLVVVKGRRVSHLMYRRRVHRAVQPFDLGLAIWTRLRGQGDSSSSWVRYCSMFARLLPRVRLLLIIAESTGKLVLHLLVAVVYQMR